MADVVNQYFAAYRASDYEALSALWHPDFEFSDPAFPDLKGKNAKAMFHMFTTNAQKTQMVVTPSPAEPVPGQDGKFKVEYTCDYVYGSQKVHNPITAIVEIKDGKVFRQTDDFDFGGWAKQALGLVVGSGLYYLGLLPGTVQKKAADRLKGWCDTHEEFKDEATAHTVHAVSAAPSDTNKVEEDLKMAPVIVTL